MSRSVAIRRRGVWRAPPDRRHLLLAGGAVLLLLLMLVGTSAPGRAREIFAALIVGNLITLSVRSPRAAAVATLTMLAVLGLVRRLFIPVAGLSTSDPLLLIAPVVALVLLHRVFGVWRRGRVAEDTLSRMILALLILTGLETLNPVGGGLLPSVTGLLFLAAPLLWYFIGREIADEESVRLLLGALVLMSIGIALYGLAQTSLGFPSWDAEWVRLHGYTALNVGGVIRPFGTLASAAEYATFMAVGLTLMVVFALHRHPLPLLGIPLVGWALLLASSRGPVLLAVLALVAVAGLRTGRGLSAAAVVVTTLAAAVAAAVLWVPSLASKPEVASSPLLAHQLVGLTNPLNPNDSTLLQHQDMVQNGLSSALSHPLGLGTAATNLAGTGAGGSVGTELDVSDEFVALGAVGGLLFVATVALTLRRMVRACLRGPSLARLAVAGVLVVTLGQWLNGAFYAIAPLVWFLAGWIGREGAPERTAAMAVQG